MKVEEQKWGRGKYWRTLQGERGVFQDRGYAILQYHPSLINYWCPIITFSQNTVSDLILDITNHMHPLRLST